MKILALDFDGVIADSQMECLFVGFNSYLKLHKNTRLFDGERLTFDNFNRLTKEHNKTVNKYKKLRPYVLDAFCWYVIFYIMENKVKIKNENQYNQLRKKLMKKIYDKYVKYFYNERSILQKKDFNKWFKLEIPFKTIINAIKRLGKKYTLAIATNNRKESIQPFLENYKIKPKIISDSKISVDKKKQLTYIKNGLKAKFGEIHFVDDNVENFKKLLKLRINCYLATWGYNTKKQQKGAKKSGAILLNQNNFYEILSKLK